jgi:chemotaxis protein MotB
MAEEEVPIRIVKKKARHAGHHGGAWKVAYADFVTAMMALFIVLWIVGQSKQVKEYVANYFKDPGAFFTNTKGGGPFEYSQVATGERSVIDDLLKREQKRLKEMGNEIMKTLETKSGLEKLSKQVKMELVKEGLRIELMEQSQSFFFDVGTAELKPEAKEIVKVIGREVSKLPNHVIIEGHTDSRPYSREDGYSNYELSVDRANSARRTMVSAGMQPAQVDEVRGYADKILRNRQDPLDVTNRRISVLIKYQETTTGGDKQNPPR